MTNAEPGKSRRGGRRIGAGRKKKGHQTPSSLSGIDLKAAMAAPPPDNIDVIAQKHARDAIDALVKQMTHGQSETAKINAANEILDRGYCKPSSDAAGMQMSFFGPGISVVVAEELKNYARTFAHLAIEVLKKISSNGDSESARVSASKSLLARGVGTVTAARVPAGVVPQQPGKKEEAAQAARNIGAGRFATPSAPRALTETIQ